MDERSLGRSAAQMDLETMRRWAEETSLDDPPEKMLKMINLIGGKVATIRAYAKRVAREQEARADDHHG